MNAVKGARHEDGRRLRLRRGASSPARRRWRSQMLAALGPSLRRLLRFPPRRRRSRRRARPSTRFRAEREVSISAVDAAGGGWCDKGRWTSSLGVRHVRGLIGERLTVSVGGVAGVCNATNPSRSVVAVARATRQRGSGASGVSIGTAAATPRSELIVSGGGGGRVLAWALEVTRAQPVRPRHSYRCTARRAGAEAPADRQRRTGDNGRNGRSPLVARAAGRSGLGGGGGGGGYFGGGGGAGDTPAQRRRRRRLELPRAGGDEHERPDGHQRRRERHDHRSPARPASLSTSSLSLGSEPIGSIGTEQTVAVTNNGSSPLIIAGVQPAGADPGDYLIIDGCVADVQPGASCELGVRFAPQATGASSATLTIISNAANALTVGVSGIGTAPSTGATGPAGPQDPPGRPDPPEPREPPDRPAPRAPSCAATPWRRARCARWSSHPARSPRPPAATRGSRSCPATTSSAPRRCTSPAETTSSAEASAAYPADATRSPSPSHRKRPARKGSAATRLPGEIAASHRGERSVAPRGDARPLNGLIDDRTYLSQPSLRAEAA